jgi:anti-anti-sigma factor
MSGRPRGQGTTVGTSVHEVFTRGSAGRNGVITEVALTSRHFTDQPFGNKRMALIDDPIVHPFPPFALRDGIESGNVPRLRAQLLAYAATSEGDVVCDCSDLDYIDASGVTALIELQRDLATYGRQFWLVNVGHVPHRTSDIARLLDTYTATR